MTTSKSNISPLLYQKQIHIHHSRRLLLHNPPPPLTTTPPPSTRHDPMDPIDPYNGGHAGFDANVVMVLSVLLCALVCSLGLNSIIKCALRYSTNNSDPTTRIPKTGIKKKALKSFVTVSYNPDLTIPGLDSQCVICLSEFGNGDKVRILPKCNHGFHVRCIDKWLNSHSTCPTCRHCLIDTCEKIIGCDERQVSSSQPPQTQIMGPPQEITVNVAPLEREDLVRCYRGN